VRESAREREGGSERMRERGSISLTTHTTTSGSHTSSALEEVEEVEEEEDGGGRFTASPSKFI